MVKKELTLAIILFIVAASFLIFESSLPQGFSKTNDIPTLNTKGDSKGTFSKETIGDIKVEIYHFHGTQQCYSCRTVGSLANKTVNTYFKSELALGSIVFDSINIDLPENKGLALQYGATGSSLWIGTYIESEFHKEENTNVWYKISDEQDYLQYLKGILEKRLLGNLT